MLNKFVNCDINLVQFFYPHFIVKDTVTFLDKELDIIYIGKAEENLRDKLENNTKSFISLVGVPELDLSFRKAQINFVFTKLNRNLEPHVELYLNNLDDIEFNYFIKSLYFNGTFPYQINKTLSVFSLFKSFDKSFIELLEITDKLFSTYNFNIIESSFLSFLGKISNEDYESVSPYYAMIMKSASRKIKNRLKPAVYNYSRSSHTKTDFIALLMELRGK